MADPFFIHMPLWGLVTSIAVISWAGMLTGRLLVLWRWTTQPERWRKLQRKRRERARRLLGLT